MPLSTPLALTDREKAALPATRQLRAQLSPFLILFTTRSQAALDLLPSVVANPLRNLILALPAWEALERETSAQPCGCDPGAQYRCELHR